MGSMRTITKCITRTKRHSVFHIPVCQNLHFSILFLRSTATREQCMFAYYWARERGKRERNPSVLLQYSNTKSKHQGIVMMTVSNLLHAFQTTNSTGSKLMSNVNLIVTADCMDLKDRTFIFFLFYLSRP